LFRFNHNVILAAFWATFEIFRDPNLLVRVREDVAACMTGEGPTSLNVERLIKIPLLQSVFAETLRLRVHIFNSRCIGNDGIQVNNWLLREKSIVLVSSTLAHLEAAEWNSGCNGEHPLDMFWAERFVVYPNDPFSGPNKRRPEKVSPTHEPYFQLDSSMAGRFVPFGGGAYTCPGRHFAKREVILTCAMMATHFDVEIAASGQNVKMDWSTGGFGTLKPSGKIAYRVRGRRGGPIVPLSSFQS
jgi:cytochrome P450